MLMCVCVWGGRWRILCVITDPIIFSMKHCHGMKFLREVIFSDQQISGFSGFFLFFFEDHSFLLLESRANLTIVTFRG